ncbi:Unknown protein sequence [Pseudomonas syringae pv. cilantro]|uniref:Uncharacterized protein n=1 Tax=Pseudomonas syringae pv. cilantro TaxID=81035 RepID=A0A0N0XBS2_PSESX|nr:Unknown protein sequence [Pseudomonas syringae pv. cilantro]
MRGQSVGQDQRWHEFSSPLKEGGLDALATGPFQLVLILILIMCINYDRCHTVM